VFCLIQVLELVFAGFDLVLYKRWNLQWHIPDHAFVLCGTVIMKPFQMKGHLSLMLLISRLCPDNIEATVFALLAGMFSVGVICSHLFGAYLLEIYSLDQVNGKDWDDFSNLWKASLTAACLATLSLPMLPFLIPNVPMTSQFTIDRHDTSVLARWMVADDGKSMEFEASETEIVEGAGGNSGWGKTARDMIRGDKDGLAYEELNSIEDLDSLVEEDCSDS
ncbi:hypothetical protein CYMTET_52492, partial [Cymbomonas tetramitiformis]